ncbi:hypothetical protein Tco_0456773, partial [Tanacetum coccineum]
MSMSYVPVNAGYQTNDIAGNKDNIVAGNKDNIVACQAKKDIEPAQEYILIPLCTTDPLISQDPKDREVDTGIFGNVYDDEDMEEEVDMNNVASSYTVPDGHSTKFLKDHPQDQ